MIGFNAVSSNKLRRRHGKVKDIYESKELWRGPESIYRKEGVLALSGGGSSQKGTGSQ